MIVSGVFVAAVACLLVPGASRASGDDPGASTPPDESGGLATIVVAPVADATVSKAHPSRNYGSSSRLRVARRPRSSARSYLMFRVPEAEGRFVAAKLSARVGATRTWNGPAVYTTRTTWKERTITWRTRLRPLGAPQDDVGRVSSHGWVEWDVSGAVRGAGTYSFVLVGDSRQSLALRSRKTSKPPKLVVTTSSDTLSPTAPTDLHEEASNGSTVSLAWGPSSDNVGVVGYRAYRDGAFVATTALPPYTFTGLACGASYSLAVEAYDLTGNVSERSSLTASTADCPPQTGPDVRCTQTLAPSGDLSAFLDSLEAGDTGCLRGGTYTDGSSVTLSASGVTLTEYPGEQAVIVGTGLNVSGTNNEVSELTIRDALGTDVSGIRVDGTGNRVVHNRIVRVAKHGIILGSSSSGATIARNFVDEAGADNAAHVSDLGPSQVHGIYVQGSGHEISRNVFTRMTGYGIHLYSSPSNILVSGNTAVGSTTRTGLLVRTTGSGIVVVDNVFEGGTLHSCGGCLIDTNQVAGGWSFQDSAAPSPTHTLPGPLVFADGELRLGGGSLAVDAGRSDYAVSPDLDGRPIDATPDLGAYER